MKKIVKCVLIFAILAVSGCETNNAVQKEEWIEHTVVKTERAYHDCTLIKRCIEAIGLEHKN